MNPTPTPAFDADRAVDMGRRALAVEAAALEALGPRLGDAFAQAVATMLACQGRVCVMGMGKSGHVGRKIAATLASTGTPALFVHPAEASHGDLGMVTPQDVVLALSNSGESDELNAILPVLRRLFVPIVAMTGGAKSSLARHANVVLDSAVAEEACPLQLAPTASTTAQMALGDALAVALLDARGFRAEDFARSHPGGALGRKLLTHVRDLMRTELPRVTAATPFTEMMRAMSAGGLGMAVLVDAADRIEGIFTDGDLRRLVESGRDLRALTAAEVAHPNPRRVAPDALAVDAADVMEAARITVVLVADADARLLGAVSINDLMRAKVI
ncbi:MAG: KpsF/GutQ family sugar-phosphate isomerase [Pelomonas sp.]|nr:KpsF/GutQ family sugar-phosphate isomerase [Roseateles sp.]